MAVKVKRGFKPCGSLPVPNTPQITDLMLRFLRLALFAAVPLMPVLLDAQPQTSAADSTRVRAQSTPAQADLRAEVERANQAMVTAFDRGDFLAVARFYTDDARIIGPGGQRISGRDAINAYWTSMSAGGGEGRAWKLEVLEVGGDAATPFQVGRSTLSSSGAGGRREMVSEFIGIWKRQPTGELKLYIDIWHPAASTGGGPRIRRAPEPSQSPRLPSAAERTIDAQTARQMVDTVAALVATTYLVPDTGRLIAEHLLRRARSGVYDRSLTYPQFAEAVSRDMKTVNGDLHLSLLYNLNAPSTAAGPRIVRREAPASSGSGGASGSPQIVRRMAGSASPADLEISRRSNFGFAGVQRLAGNVGYLELSLVSSRGGQAALDAAAAAMAFLSNTDAIILDVRRTPGGDPRMSDFLASYFFGPDSVQTLTSENRSMGFSDVRWTHSVPGERRPNVDVYVLTGPGTASGAEDFSFIFKQLKRGTLVGERTAGAGRMNSIVPVGNGFSASVSTGRTFDPRTGSDWERVGVKPDITVQVDQALPAAHIAALARLAGNAADSTRKQELAWIREMLEVQSSPINVAASTLNKYAGSYGSRIITLDEGRLYYQREAGRPRDLLVPLSESVFALGEGTVRIAFSSGSGPARELRVLTPSGASSAFSRGL
ncbi:MAG: S41 family peptidase [Gemmatimonadota bacterium]|nr:S41 family peptidase [Gemmatimonadota bacterium]